ncbi:glycoside hydrolase family 2 protein [Microlunatus aurantiacus]|uniref:beta-mannosidase n=1 Tax=Microlunatus aurantiacus TaxID=446786 RepID=A0ABP7CQQ0_9ACTN
MTSASPDPTFRRTSLDTADSPAGTGWQLSPLTGVPADWSAVGATPIRATVPGEVVADLLAADLIPDPFDGDNENRLHWIGSTDWSYRTMFAFQRGDQQRHDLVFGGLDTVATVLLNGTEIARTANQHRSYRFDVTSALRDGENDLEIRFEGPVSAAERLSAELGDRPRAYAHPFNAIRKMAAGYGWDWGPDLAGVGIWKSVGIESWSGVRLASVRPLALVEGTSGRLATHVELEWADRAGDAVEVAVTLAGQTVTTEASPGQTSVVLELTVPEVELWWPLGHGAQTRYDVTVEVAGQSFAAAVGFRTAELVTTPDAYGTGFSLVVNGTPIYVRGFNWIPDDALLTRLTPDSYRSSIGEAVAAGANLLRIWGGGIYESDDFYDVCDELGILVWQDFLFACAAYSEDEPLRSEVVAEAREAVARLASRPSLVVWNGNNENIWGYVEWGWRQQLAGRSWGNGYYTELLPAIVAELDPRTPYSPGSPFSYADYHHPNDPRSGTVHIWDVWNQLDYTHYRDYPARFVSEFGFQGPAAWSTLFSVVHDQPADPYGTQMLVHQKAHEGNLKLERGLGDHLPVWRSDPTPDMDDWHWLTSLNQARAVAYGIEHFRSLYPRNTGAIVWQLNDNWPVVSWAAVDHAGIRKPLWHALKRVYADRLLTFQPRTDHDRTADPGVEVLALVAHNDAPDAWTGELVIARRGTGDGSPVLAEQRLPLHLDARSAITVALDADVVTTDDPTGEFLVATVTGDAPATAYGYFVEDTALRLVGPDEAYAVDVTPVEDGYRVRLSARALVKDAALFPDRLGAAARVDSGLVTLAAGDTHTFVVSGAAVDEVALTARPVLRSVNDLG